MVDLIVILESRGWFPGNKTVEWPVSFPMGEWSLSLGIPRVDSDLCLSCVGWFGEMTHIRVAPCDFRNWI